MQLRSFLAFGLYPLIVVFVTQQRIHMVEGDSIDGLEMIHDNQETSDPDITEIQSDTQQELRGQLESCLADNQVLNEKLYEKTDLETAKLGKKKINDGFFKQFVRHFLEEMECLNKDCPEPYDIVYVYLTQTNIETLNKYVEGNGETADALYVMKNMIQSVQVTEYKGYWDRLLSFLGVDETSFKLIIAVAVLMFCFMAFEKTTSLTYMNQFLILILIIFVISIPWNWLQLYQEKFSERQAEMMKETDIPDYCRPQKDLSPWKAFQQFFKKITSIKDECKEFQKRYMVDPILEVSPIKAVSKTFAVLFFAPAKELGTAVADFHKEFLGNLPPLIWIPALISWILTLTVVILILYRGCGSGQHVNVHHVPAAPQIAEPSRQMVESIVQERLRCYEEEVGYRQGTRSPSLPPVTLRARGQATLQELEVENRRQSRRSQDYADSSGSPSTKKNQNVNSICQCDEKVKEVVDAQLKMYLEKKDNYSTWSPKSATSEDVSDNIKKDNISIWSPKSATTEEASDDIKKNNISTWSPKSANSEEVSNDKKKDNISTWSPKSATSEEVSNNINLPIQEEVEMEVPSNTSIAEKSETSFGETQGADEYPGEKLSDTEDYDEDDFVVLQSSSNMSPSK